MKNFIRNLSIRAKLLIGFSIVMTMIVLIGIWELSLLREIEYKRKTNSNISIIFKQLEEIKFVLSSETTIIEALNEYSSKKDVQSKAAKHFSNSNLLNNSSSIILKKLKRIKNIYIEQTNNIHDSVYLITNSFEKDINPNFTEINQLYNKFKNIDIYYIEHIKIMHIDSISGDTLTPISKKDLQIQLINKAKELKFVSKKQLKNLIKISQNLKVSSQKMLTDVENQTKELVTSKINEIFVYLILIFLISALVLWYISQIIIAPVSKLQRHLNLLTKGELPDEIKVGNNDEIGKILQSLNTLVTGLKETANFSIEIGKRNFSSSYTPLGKTDILGNSLLSMRESLQTANEEEKKRKIEDAQRNRTSEGLTLFGDILRRHSDDINRLADNIISNLVKFVNANQGGIFVLNDDDKTLITLDLVGAYAYNRKKFIDKKIKLGEGLVGAVAIEKYTIYMTEVPNEYIQIESGIGKANPKSILIVPLKIDEEILGVIELASFNEFEEYEIRMIERIAESIASTLSTARINTKTANLLEQSNIQAERMKEQEEEMLQNIEELKATQEEGVKREKELEKTYEKLQKVYQELSDKEINQKIEIKKLKKLNSENIEKIKENMGLSTTILEKSINAILLLNNKFEIEVFNNAAERHFGYKKEEVLGKPFFILMQESVRKRIKEDPMYIHEKIITDGKESVIIAKDKKEVPVFYSMTKFEYSNKEKYSVFLKNISWEKAQESEKNKLMESIMAKEFTYEAQIEKLERTLRKNGIKTDSETETEELVSWTDELSINIDIIDMQHKKWLDIINSFYSNFLKGEAFEKLSEIFRELTDYTDYHFGFEEKYMKDFGYSDIKEHQKTHAGFINTLKKYQEEYKDQKIDSAYKLMGFLRKWVRKHITEDDKSYSYLFKQNGLT